LVQADGSLIVGDSKDKRVDVIAVADSVGYTDADGNVQYAERGDEISISEADYKRHGERTDVQLNEGNYPAVVKPDHPHLEALKTPVSAAKNPMETLGQMRAIHGGSAAPLLLDPALLPATKPSTTAAPAAAPGTGLSVDWSELSKDQLEAVATAAGIDAKGMKKDELVAALNAASSGAGVTPRVGSTPDSAEAETGADGSEG
jgi:hypothetical protein